MRESDFHAAKRMMVLAKEVGFTIWGDENEVVSRIVEMEARVRVVSKKADQETKTDSMVNSWCDWLWGGAGCGWFLRPSASNFRDLLNLWDASFFFLLTALSQGARNMISHLAIMLEFNEFIYGIHVFESPICSRKYTWSKKDSSSMRRLDRFLTSIDWEKEWGLASQWIMNRNVFNHFTILLKHGNED
ncbi:hypothetical protein RIF29_34100 [Crotalaria pallida]|uniref:Uncharacterized protein n=1 Tax=Crotalaria pallida TaxID=3830 RepID=A0AAN9HX80_CROPI